MQSVIIDTDIAIDYLRGIKQAHDLILPLWKTNTAHLSILSVYELYAGMRESEKEATENFITACSIEPVTIGIAEKGGELYRLYRKQGITLTSNDCLIQATAIINRHKVATKNKGHYPDKTIILEFG